MFQSFSEHLEAQGRLAACYALIAALFMLNMMALALPGAGAVEVPFVLMAVYYWAVYRPTLIPVWFVFAAGLLMDVLMGLPLGLNAFVFVLVRWLVSEQRLFLMGQSYMTLWLGFGAVAVAAHVLQWAVFCLVNFTFALPLRPPAAAALLGTLLFPPVTLALHMTHKMLPRQHSHLRTKSPV